MTTMESVPYNLQFEADNYNKYNKSTWFLLACLTDYDVLKSKKELTYFSSDFRFGKEYIDSYTKGMAEYDSLDCPLYLRYKWENTEEYKRFEEFITTHPNYVSTEDFEEDTIYIFNIDSTIYNLFKEGQYSKFNPEYKIKTLLFFGLSTEGIVNRIFRKDHIFYQMRRMFLGCLKGNNCTCQINSKRNQAGELVSQDFDSCKYYSSFDFPDRLSIELESPPNEEEIINFIV